MNPLAGGFEDSAVNGILGLRDGSYKGLNTGPLRLGSHGLPSLIGFGGSVHFFELASGLGPPAAPKTRFGGRVPRLKRTTDKVGTLVPASLLEDLVTTAFPAFFYWLICRCCRPPPIKKPPLFASANAPVAHFCAYAQDAPKVVGFPIKQRMTTRVTQVSRAENASRP